MGLLSVIKPVLISIPCAHLFAILFGAPFFYDFVVTLLFSVWISLLSVLPLSLATDGSIVQMLTIFFEQKCSTKFQEYSLWTSFGSIFGSWISASVIILDWDRWWQRWPISCVFGSTFGFLLGVIFVWLKIRLKQMNSTQNKKSIIKNTRKQV